MKLLVVVSSIYDKDLFKKRKSITGIEIMVRDILDGVSQEIDCSVFTTSLKSKGQKIGKIKLLPNNFLSFLRIIRNVGLGGYISYVSELSEMKLAQRLKLAVSMILLDYHISSLKPDMVNIHDLNDWNTFIVKKILSKGVKVLLTVHLYIGKKDRIYGYNSLRNNEESVFNINNSNLYLSFVSTGMRERFLGDYRFFPSYRAFCIVNGTRTVVKNVCKEKPGIFEKFRDRKVLLCIGGFTARKNQQSIIDTFKTMDLETKEKICVLFIGVGKRRLIKEYLFKTEKKQSLFYIGKVSPEEMANYYYFSDGTITTSLNESFGLTIIEGFCYGKPAILYNDIDSFHDIYDEKACVQIENHSSEKLVSAISNFLKKDWDSSYIKSITKKYSLERVQKDYVDLYNSICSLDD